MSGARNAVSDAELCAFLDGEISAERRGEIETWVSAHPEASKRLAAWRRQKQTIRAIYERVAQEPLPDFLTAPLPEHRVAPFPHAVAHLRGEPPLDLNGAAARPEAAARQIGSLRIFALVLLALAAVLGLFASGLLQSLNRPAINPPLAVAPAPGQSLMRRAVEAHLSFANLAPARLDETGVNASALAQRAGLGLRMPESPAPLRPIGLRLMAGEREMAGFVLFDGIPAGRLGLYVAHSEAPSAPGITLRETDGLSSALFVKNGVAYVLTGRIARAHMLELAHAMRESLR